MCGDLGVENLIDNHKPDKKSDGRPQPEYKIDRGAGIEKVLLKRNEFRLCQNSQFGSTPAAQFIPSRLGVNAWLQPDETQINAAGNPGKQPKEIRFSDEHVPVNTQGDADLGAGRHSNLPMIDFRFNPFAPGERLGNGAECRSGPAIIQRHVGLSQLFHGVKKSRNR